MKKIISLIIVACMLVAFVGCEGEIADNGSESAATGGVTTENDSTNESKADVGESDGTESKFDGEESESDSTESEGYPESDSETINDESDKVEISEDHTPDFEIIDWNGNKVKLSDLFGKPIVLNFWASGCGPCRNEMPDFQVAYEKYGDEVQFMMVNFIGFFGETVDSAKAFINDQGYTFPVYFDTDNRAAATYGINSIPQTFFIGANGELVAYGQGMLDMSALEQGISMIID